jgi:hypothetical protein
MRLSNSFGPAELYADLTAPFELILQIGAKIRYPADGAL